MQSEELDDLFRRRLEGHETPPDAALWARLAAGTPPEAAVDDVFRAGLNAHTSPVRRELWERLEDEHLRPRQRRAVAFWPLALAAVLALLVVAGGAGLWLKGRVPVGAGGPTVAQSSRTKQNTKHRVAHPTTDATAAGTATAAARAVPSAAATASRAAEQPKNSVDAATTATTQNTVAAPRRPRANAWASPKPAFAVISEKNRVAQATRRRQPASSAPGNEDNGLAARPAPASAAPQPAVALAPSTRPDAAGKNPAFATATPAPDLASPAGTIEVDVRPGGERPAAASPTAGLAAAETRRGNRAGRVLGGLLRQAGNLAQGQPLSLADATGLGPQTLTLEARLGRRTVSKSIQL